MAASEVTISANSLTTDGTEQNLFTAITAAGSYQLEIDLSNLAGGATPDIIELRVYTKPHTGGTERQEGPTYTYVGGLAPASARSFAVMSPNSIRWTIKRVQGTDRSYAYALYQT